MSWAAVAGAAVGVVGGALSNSGKGGGGSAMSSQTQSKAPWEAVQPWLMNNVWLGQDLQNRYTANPFSLAQKQAYGNQFANSNNLRDIAVDVNTQMRQRQPFNRGMPSAVPKPFALTPPNVSYNLGMGPTYNPETSPFNSGVFSSALPQQVPQAPAVNLDESQLRALLEKINTENALREDGGGE